MGRLIARDKCPGVRPVGIGEIWSRLIAKVILAEAGQEAKNTCGDDQLCAGLETGIERGIHAVTHWWKKIELEEKNGLIGLKAMVLTSCLLPPKEGANTRTLFINRISVRERLNEAGMEFIDVVGTQVLKLDR
jgi:hypothetical protein